MLPVSQILERNIALFNSGHWLIVNPPESSWVNLCHASEFTVLHQFFDVFQQCTGFSSKLEFDSRDIATKASSLCFTLSNGRHQHTFAPFLEEGEFDHILLCIPKSKAQLRLLVDMASARLKPDGRIYLVGENRGGIKSVAKLLTSSGTATKVDSARHCTLLCYRPNETGQFNGLDYLTTIEYTAAQHNWLCCGYPGVFSNGELDDGTALLLQHLPPSLWGNSLDFACGAGVIASYLMTKTPHLTMQLLDVSALALFASAHTLRQNNLHAKLIAANGLTGLTGQYDQIVTNPPFHSGVHTDYEVTQRFIHNVADILAKDGKMYIVANTFLPYLPLLQQQFTQVDIIEKNARFTVYQAS